MDKILKRHFRKDNTLVVNKHIKRHSTWLVIREMKIEITRYYYISIRRVKIKKKWTKPNGAVAIEQLELSYIADGNVKYTNTSETPWQFLTMLNTHLLYIQEKWKHICTQNPVLEC